MEHVSSVHPTGKFPEKVENLKRWSRFPGWNFRTECRVPFTFLVVCTSSRSTVGHRDVLGFTTKWNNFLPIGIPLLLPPKFTGFFPKWKAPQFSRYLERSEWIHVVTRIQSSAARQYGNFRQMVNTTYRPYRTKIPNRNFQNFVINDSQYSNLR